MDSARQQQKKALEEREELAAKRFKSAPGSNVSVSKSDWEK